MNTLLRKEIRLLLPAWLAALAAAMVPVLLRINDSYVSGTLVLLCFGIAILFLGLTPFGQEINLGTFGLLLAQPEERERVWGIKAVLLSIALLSASALFILCWWLATQTVTETGRQFMSEDFGSIGETAGMAGLLALLAFSGGLWTTLLLRDVAASLLATLLVPITIFGGIYLGLRESTAYAEPFCILALGLYAIVGVMVSRHLLVHAEDLPWTGGQISLADGRTKSLRWLSLGFSERRGPWTALFFKELQLQEITMVLVPLLLALHLALVAVRHFAPVWAASVHHLDYASFLWLIVPLVVGCVAVAEERRHSTWESALCLPVPQRRQFAVKFVTVIILGTTLGSFVPSLLEWVVGGKEYVGSLTISAAAIAAVSFLGSTMCRGMLQCFTVTALTTLGALVVYGLIGSRMAAATNLNVIYNGGALFPVLAWSLGGAVYVFLVFKNCRMVRTGMQVWLGSFAWIAAFVISTLLITTATYERVWEFVIPLEPKHGPARLSGTGRPMIVSGSASHFVYALLPDGRLWRGHRDRQGDAVSGHFVDGSDWLDVAANQSGDVTALAVKKDGTLWKFNRIQPPVQVGAEANWKKVIGTGFCFLALKQNGKVWILSPVLQLVVDGEDAWLHQEIKTQTPGKLDSMQLGNDSDWVDLQFSAVDQIGLVKSNGTLWGWMPASSTPGRPTPSQLSRLPDFDSDTAATNWISIAESGSFKFGVRRDGTLWTGPNTLEMPVHAVDMASKSRTVRVGTKSDWVSVSELHLGFVASEADGTVWAIETRWGQTGFIYNRNHEITQVVGLEMKPSSRYRDWLTATGCVLDTWALAKDGTISHWANSFIEFPDEKHQNDWIRLRPSRRPLASVNIFDGK